MEQLIPVVNKLQDVFNTIGQSKVGVDLPQIVVVGSQSSGKSSVLESLVGRGFLPRGAGICTRRPLMLQLFNTSGSSTTNQPQGNNLEQNEWAEFLHRPGEKFYNFEQVREEILQETNRLAGSNSGISDQAIRLKIFSPNVLTLTLVDLPGITKIPVGDQPSDIEQLTRNMCLEFCSNPNAIILAVSAATTDLANSDALQLAQEVDPEGKRTLGVLTKLDLMDDGTDATDMLSGKIIPLRRGYIGMVNRSQADIDKHTEMKESLKKERAFFLNHPSYRNIANEMGTRHLAKVLNGLLLAHIRDCLPEIKVRVNHQLHEVEMSLTALGESPIAGQGRTEKSALLLKLISQFATEFSHAIEGTGENIEFRELRGGARIRYIFNEVFNKALYSISPFQGLTDADIRTAINNSTGAKTALFVPEVSFEILVKRQISLLEKPSLQCVELVYDELQTVAAQCETRELSRFSILRDRILESVNDLLRSCLAPTQDMVANLIQIELAYINTAHPDFQGGSRAVAELANLNLNDDSRQQPRLTASASGSSVATGDHKNPAFSSPQQSTSEPGDVIDKTDSSSSFMSVIFGKDRAPQTMSGARNMMDPASLAAMHPQRGHRGRTPNGLPERVHSAGNLDTVPSSVRQNDIQENERQRMETQIIKSLMRSYLGITKDHVQDLVPKTIMYFLVNRSKNHIQSELVSKLYRDDHIDALLKEDENVSERRKEFTRMRQALKEALSILHEVRDFKIPVAR